MPSTVSWLGKAATALGQKAEGRRLLVPVQEAPGLPKALWLTNKRSDLRL